MHDPLALDTAQTGRQPRRPRQTNNRASAWVLGVVLAALLCVGMPTAAQPGGQVSPVGAGEDPQTVAGLFADFLHFSILGRFETADSYAVQLLEHPDLDPVEVLRLSEQNQRSMETLVILVGNSTIGERAARILEVIREGEHTQRKDTDRILTNIDKLGGPPQMEYNATQRLADSGEYAIPWLIHALRDEAREKLWPRVVRALPQMGKPAVNPLVQGLAIEDENLRQTMIETLGEIGYTQAIPYLLALTIDDRVSSDSKQAAMAAIARIERHTGRQVDGSAADGFVRLGEQFYDEHGSVRADVRVNQANVWYWDAENQFLESVAVPRSIFGSVMAMRCSERALQINADHAEAIALWLAANIRRESRLGMNVESGDATETGEADPTRPEHFPRALYFSSAAGPQYAHMVLERAVDDLDAAVALGAIAALQRVAGPASLIGSEDYKQAFAEALKFPDLVVRIRAALAVGNALPRSPFRGAELVVPILGKALTLTGRRNVLVVGADEDRVNRLLSDLRDADVNVIGETNALRGLNRARSELESLDAMFISSAITNPEPAEAIAAVRGRRDVSLTPIVLMVEPDQTAMAELIVGGDPGVESVDAGASREALLERLAMVAKRLGQTPVDPDTAHELALLAAGTLHRIALDGRSVFNAAVAEKAVISAAGSVHEDLQIASIDVLALLPGGAAQSAIAQTALQRSNTESLRIAAFAGLSESAKRFSNQLDDDRVDELLEFSFDEPNLRLRTAASHALGALNIAADRASRIPLKYHRG